MTPGRRRFELVPPDWGQDHLTSDAIVAFVDDELQAGARARAADHLAACPECAAEVVAQRQTRATLRSAGGPALPSSLLRNLRAIPHAAELPGMPAGLAMAANGALVTADVGQRGPGRGVSRRAWIGAGAAVSGLALGAIAFAMASVDSVPAQPVERGVLGGSLLTTTPGPTVDVGSRIAAELSASPLWERMDAMPALFGRSPKP
jgi:anti-sigma factor RsiW